MKSIWNPVSESLPEKNQQVLATYKNSYGRRVTIIASYVREHEEESGYDDDESTYEYCEEDDAYYLKEGWYELIDNWPDYSSVAVYEGEVDYWMQMPEFKEGMMEKTEMMKKKAYHVRIDNDEGYCIVVFAENRNKAKLLAMGDDNFDSNYIKYTDIHPIRMPQADFFTEKYPDLCNLDIANPEHAKFLRDEGWWNFDCSYCEECGLATFEAVPESQLEYVNGRNICLECLKEREVRNGKD